MNASPARGDAVRLQRLLANTLGAVEQAGLVAHLDTCPECQRSLEALAAAQPRWDERYCLAGQVMPALHTGKGQRRQPERRHHPQGDRRP